MVTDKAFAALLGGNTLDAFISLFEDVSGVLFWVKDDQHRVRALNTTFAERVKMPAEDVIGKTDRQLYYTELARVFMADDQRVLETGVPMRKKVVASCALASQPQAQKAPTAMKVRNSLGPARTGRPS